MNIMFPFVVCFGVVFVGILIAQVVFNARVGGSSQPAPWMRRLRQFQDKTENEGWRIRMIPYDDPNKPMMMNWGGIVGMVPIVGGFGFIGALGMLSYNPARFQKPGLILAGVSFVTMLFGVWLKARREHQGWDIVPARCTDRELRKVLVSTDSGSGWTWVWRIMCEYPYLGTLYHVTPQVYWSSFASEEAALKFLEERISPTGECTLRINTKNPFQTELYGQGIRDKLLF